MRLTGGRSDVFVVYYNYTNVLPNGFRLNCHHFSYFCIKYMVLVSEIFEYVPCFYFLRQLVACLLPVEVGTSFSDHPTHSSVPKSLVSSSHEANLTRLHSTGLYSWDQGYTSCTADTTKQHRDLLTLEVELLRYSYERTVAASDMKPEG